MQSSRFQRDPLLGRLCFHIVTPSPPFFFRRVFAEESKEVPSGRVFQRLIGVVSLADVDKAGMTS